MVRRANGRSQRRYEGCTRRVTLRRSSEAARAGTPIAGNRRQRDRGRAVAHNAVLLPGLLVRNKEEELVLLDRPAEGPAKLIGIQHRLGKPLEIADPVVGVQRAIAEKFKRASVEA